MNLKYLKILWKSDILERRLKDIKLPKIFIE